jgi:hypothetical protein
MEKDQSKVNVIFRDSYQEQSIEPKNEINTEDSNFGYVSSP